MGIKFKFSKTEGLVQEKGNGSVEIEESASVNNGLKVSRNVTFSCTPTLGVGETSGSLLQLKNKPDRPSINFHVGGNQYMTQNSWFDSDASDWVHEENHAAFGLEFKRVKGAFAIVYGPERAKGDPVNGNGAFSTGLSLTGSTGAISVGKKAENGVSATFDITGSNAIALAVTGSADIGGGAPDSFFAVPRLTTAQRDALTNVFDGQLIYNTSDSKFQGRAGGSWVTLH